jgi:tRNA-intron endonuclease
MVAFIAGAFATRPPVTTMEATLSDGVVHASGNARERFYDSQGYGQPRANGALALAPVEAAHLLFRGDLDAVDGMDFHDFLASGSVSETVFLVYKDLRDRGFYLSPAREAFADDPDGADLIVYPRGKGPWDDEVAYRIRVVGERTDVPATELGDVVLAVVDEESEITYFETGVPEIEGNSRTDLPAEIEGELLSDRVTVPRPPEGLYEECFYGQPLDESASDVLQLSLLEAAYLAREGALAVDGGAHVLQERGRAVEGERFDRRLAVYTTLRERGVVPKTGFKFGADFRTYADVESVADLGHSEFLVRVVPGDHVFSPRDLALDVRLAHGVRKRMVFALTDAKGAIDWLTVTRLTP